MRLIGLRRIIYFNKKIMILIISVLFVVSLVSCEKRYNDDEINPELLEELEEILVNAVEINNFYSISITMDGEMVSENYYRYRDEESSFNVFSVTKSVTSLLVGIAIDKGYIDNVDQSIGEFIDLDDYETSHLASTITIRNLLTMSDGLEWDSNNLSGEMINLRGSHDALKSIIEREVLFTPGTSFNYSDGAAHLMSIILKEATGMNAHDFAVVNLFIPLGISGTYWNEDEQGNNIGGCDLFLTSNDLSKIGNLVLNNGVYNGSIIISESWIEESTTNQTSSFFYYGYGYYWWLSNKSGFDLISARGWGGQQIYIVPELNIVITTTANGMISDQAASQNFDDIEQLIVNQIIPLFIEEYN